MVADLQLFEPGVPDEGFFPRGDVSTCGLKRGAILNLVREAEIAQSDALILIKNGLVIAERYFNRDTDPTDLMSVTKSIVSLSIGPLTQNGRIPTVDAPISTWLAGWDEGSKSKVTLRHILTHTSGLEPVRSAEPLVRASERTPSIREFHNSAMPGVRFAYSNEATQLLSHVVNVASGMRLCQHVKSILFDPLGIYSWYWNRNSFGEVSASSGLSLNARDLAKIGLLMLNEGEWGGRIIVPREWVRQSTAPGQPFTPFYGFLWWLRQETRGYVLTKESLQTLEGRGFHSAYKLHVLIDRPFPNLDAYWLEVGSLLDSGERTLLLSLQGNGACPVLVWQDHPPGYYADGWLGQRLVVYPGWNLVAVRLHRTVSLGDEEENLRCGFSYLIDILESL